MQGALSSGTFQVPPCEPGRFGYAVGPTGRLALSEVVGDYEVGVTIPDEALDALALAVARALVARADHDNEEEEDCEYTASGLGCLGCGGTLCPPGRCHHGRQTGA